MPRRRHNSPEMEAVREQRRQHREALALQCQQEISPEPEVVQEQTSPSQNELGGDSISMMTREEMVSVLRAIGQRVPKNIGDDRLRERIRELSNVD